jgi:hypothetical protein
MLHLDRSRKLICEPEAYQLSKAMGQVLLPPIEGGPCSYLHNCKDHLSPLALELLASFLVHTPWMNVVL